MVTGTIAALHGRRRRCPPCILMLCVSVSARRKHELGCMFVLQSRVGYNNGPRRIAGSSERFTETEASAALYGCRCHCLSCILMLRVSIGAEHEYELSLRQIKFWWQ